MIMRDIWEYQLNLNQEEIGRMLRHMWELRNVYFEYYFLTENCAYQLLGLLEAVRPSLHLRDEFPFYVIPTDIIRALLSVQELVIHRKYRPSRWSKLHQKLLSLNSKEEKVFYQLMKLKQAPFPKENWEGLENESKARIFDTLNDYYVIEGRENSKELRKDILRERAK